MFKYLFDGPNMFDFYTMIVCLVSATIGCFLPRTQDVFVGEKYGKNNSAVNILRECARLIWFLSSLFLLFRSVVVGLREFSFAILFFYVAVVLLTLIPALVLAPFIEKRWHKKHRKEALDIALSNPIFSKINEIWKANNNFQAVYILSDRAVFLCTPVLPSSLGTTSQKINTPVTSNSNAKSAVNAAAQNWKTAWQTTFVNNHKNEFSLLYSSLGYDNASDLTIEQLGDALAEVLKLEMGTIKGKFDLDYTSAYSYLAGMGDTLRQRTDVDHYSATTTVTAAGVVYKLEQPIISEVSKNPQLKKW